MFQYPQMRREKTLALRYYTRQDQVVIFSGSTPYIYREYNFIPKEGKYADRVVVNFV